MSTLQIRLMICLSTVHLALGSFLYFFYPLQEIDRLIALVIIVGTAFLVSAILVFLVTISPGSQILKISEAIRGLSFGEYAKRLDIETFGQLKEIARSFNELASHLGEKEDPNLGNIRRERRIHNKTNSIASKLSSTEKQEGFPSIGRVRTLSSSEQKKEDNAEQHSLSVLPILEEQLENAFSGTPSAVREERVDEVNDTVIDKASQVNEKQIQEKAQNNEDKILALYHAYVRLGVEVEEQFDVEFEDFKATLENEAKRLVAEHKCHDVEFEVCLQDGDVSLQPRLIR